MQRFTRFWAVLSTVVSAAFKLLSKVENRSWVTKNLRIANASEGIVISTQAINEVCSILKGKAGFNEQ